MSDTKFTPGPWVIDSHGAIVDQHGETVRIRASVSIPMSLSVPIGDEAKPNAHLIAAAPELYAMLAEIVDDGEISLHQIVRAEKALAKARGEL